MSHMERGLRQGYMHTTCVQKLYGGSGCGRETLQSGSRKFGEHGAPLTNEGEHGEGQEDTGLEIVGQEEPQTSCRVFYADD